MTLTELDSEISLLVARLDSLRAKRLELAQLADWRRYPCTCVRLNGAIGIHDNATQFAAGRTWLPGESGSVVADTLSALKRCDKCNGTGIPKERTR